MRVDVIWSLGESWLECGGGLGEKSGGVEGAGVCVCVTLRWMEERICGVMVVVREVCSNGCEGL